MCNEFYVGQDVVCIDDSDMDGQLTKGNIYRILTIEDSYRGNSTACTIIDNQNEPTWVFLSRFKPIQNSTQIKQEDKQMKEAISRVKPFEWTCPCTDEEVPAFIEWAESVGYKIYEGFKEDMAMCNGFYAVFNPGKVVGRTRWRSGKHYSSIQEMILDHYSPAPQVSKEDQEIIDSIERMKVELKQLEEKAIKRGIKK